MTSHQTGRRISAMSARRKKEGLSRREKRRLGQLVACGTIFVVLVAVKLLLPGKMEALNSVLSQAMERNMDVRAVFSAMGRAAAGEGREALGDVYQAVFHPQAAETLETAAVTTLPSALDSLRSLRESGSDGGETEAETYILYSDQNLPEHVTLEQAVLGFAFCTPVAGTLTSGFGYREHPVEGEERFHYGIDIGADTGTAIACFADGTVTAVGESSSYGKYIMVAHDGGYTSLYAHCSRILASSGAEVTRGETLAEVGETGMATGPHLHFELHRDSDYLDPVYYVSLA